MERGTIRHVIRLCFTIQREQEITQDVIRILIAAQVVPQLTNVEIHATTSIKLHRKLHQWRLVRFVAIIPISFSFSLSRVCTLSCPSSRTSLWSGTVSSASA